MMSEAWMMREAPTSTLTLFCISLSLYLSSLSSFSVFGVKDHREENSCFASATTGSQTFILGILKYSANSQPY